MTDQESTFQSEVRSVMDGLFNLLVERQRKYGIENINQGRMLGVIVRAGDKLERLKRAFPCLDSVGHDRDYSDESVDDALMDLANYAIIGLMLYRGTWGKPLAPQ